MLRESNRCGQVVGVKSRLRPDAASSAFTAAVEAVSQLYVAIARIANVGARSPFGVWLAKSHVRVYRRINGRVGGRCLGVRRCFYLRSLVDALGSCA